MNRSVLSTSALFAIASLASAQAARAAEGPDHDPSSASGGSRATQVQEVIVTANRREENIQKVPASITAISGGKLESQGVRNSNEIAQVVPNVTIDTTYQTSAPRIFIRGVGTGDSSGVASSPVGVYVDDIYKGAQDGLVFQLFDIQRVEVLKGPQGTLYGRNTTAGAINYISNAPTQTFSGNGDIRLGNYNDVAAEAAVSGPLANNLLARFAFSYEHRDGVVTDPVTGDHDGNAIEDQGFKGTLQWKPTDRLKITLNMQYSVADPYTGVYKARGYLVPGASTPCATNAILAFQCADVNQFVPNSDPYSVHSILKGRDYNQTYGGGLHVAYDFGWATLTSITGLSREYLRRLEDSGDGSNTRLLEIHYDHHTEEITQELRLTSKGGERFNWILGAYFYHEVPYVHDDYYAPFVVAVPLDQEYGQVDNAYAVFGRGDYTIIPKLKLVVGVRYTTEKKNFFENAGLNQAALGFFGLPVGPLGPPFSFFSVTKSRTDSNPSGDVSLDYQFTNDLFVYGTISRGFKSGGFNGGIVVDPADVTSFAPEILTSYEAGFKSSLFDDRVIFNASGFYYDYTNLQVQTLITINGIPAPVEDNAASARIYGLEVDSTFKPIANLTLNGTLGLLSAKFASYRSAGTGSNYTGNTLAGAPSVTASLDAAYEHPLTDAFEGFIDWHSSFRSRDYFDSSDSRLVSQGALWLTNAQVGFGPRSRGWTASLWVKNLFDKRYARDIINFETSYGYDAIAEADPRTFGIELSAKW